MKNFLILVLVFLFSVMVFGQQFQPNNLPKGAEIVSPNEAQKLYSDIENGLYSTETTQIKGGNSAPTIAIRVVGDSRTGVSAIARNTNIIRAGSIIIGVKTYPGTSPEYLQALNFSQDFDTGNFWYELENDRKAVGFQFGGLATYQILQIYNGQLFVYSADKSFYDYNNLSRPRKLITGGNTVGRKIQLFGNFAGTVGAVLYHSGSTFEWVVPPSAFTDMNQFSVTINTELIPWFGAYSGDVLITLTDGSRVSDSFTVRLP